MPKQQISGLWNLLNGQTPADVLFLGAVGLPEEFISFHFALPLNHFEQQLQLLHGLRRLPIWALFRNWHISYLEITALSIVFIFVGKK